jgi:hypothetical protein
VANTRPSDDNRDRSLLSAQPPKCGSAARDDDINIFIGANQLTDTFAGYIIDELNGITVLTKGAANRSCERLVCT